MPHPVTDAVEAGDAEQAAKVLTDGVFQTPPPDFERQPQELPAMQLDNARVMPLLCSAPRWR
ncbi:hypothetical protein [Geminicoccus harenae]|uniref:hypothetical protein n=1 Tax=Geminicoccus harenae TaxID=2498453 RepID=UPI00168B6D21|nr:hypothetical protein [Geminicoccus harenae]